MHSTRRRFLGIAALASGLAGCTGARDAGGESGSDGSDGIYGDGGGGSGGSTTTPQPTPTSTTAETATTDASAPAVQVRTLPDLGDVLVGPDGSTLYMFESDTQGEPASTCYDGCAEAWPPLLVEGEPTAGAAVSADLTTFEREGGSVQVSAAGWPLYYFASDEEPGDVNGQGVNDVWWVLRPDGAPVRSSSV